MLDKLIEFILNIIEQVLPCYIVHQYEKAVFYRTGILKGERAAGFHWKIPFLDSYHKENVVLDTMKIQEVNITTKDEQTITVGCEFDIVITDIVKATNNTNDWRTNMHEICRGILSDDLEELNWDDVRKKSTKTRISEKIAVRALEMGITTSNFNFTDKAISTAFKLFNNH